MKASPDIESTVRCKLLAKITRWTLLSFAVLPALTFAKTTQGTYDDYDTLNDGVLRYELITGGGGLTVKGPYYWTDESAPNLEIPDTVIVGDDSLPVLSISTNAFSSPYARITGVLTIPTGVTTIGRQAFLNNSMTQVNLPETLSDIGERAFSGCENLRSVKLPTRLRTLDKFTFSNCTSLSSVTFSEGLELIGYQAFRYCALLSAANLPKSLVSIEEQAFTSCTSLRNLTFGNRLTTIGISAFESCSSLEYFEIPKSVTWMGRNSFRDCTNINAVTFRGKIPKIDYLFTQEKYAFPDSNFRITITCYPGSGVDRHFDDKELFSIRYIAPNIAVSGKSGTVLSNGSTVRFKKTNQGKKSSVYTVQVKNTGTVALTSIKPSIAGGSASDFKIVGKSLPTLAPGKTTSIKVIFKPKKSGIRRTTLLIQSNDPDTVKISISLTGKGIAPKK